MLRRIDKSKLLEFASNNCLYLLILSVSVPIVGLLNYLFIEEITIKGQSLGIIVYLGAFSLSFVIWLITQRKQTTHGLTWGFAAFYILTWLALTILALRAGQASNHTAWLIPIIVLMLAVKPPTLKAAFLSTDVFMLSIVATAVISHILHVTAIHEFPHYFYESRLPALIQETGIPAALGLEFRWEGPFGSTSDAGPVGAILVGYGLMRQGWRRALISGAGLFIILAAFSWTSLFALLGGLLLAYLLLPPNNSIIRSKSFKIAASSAIFLAVIFYVVTRDPTFNGRIPIWGEYLSQWPKYPLFGAGNDVINAQTVIFSNNHAHNFYVDTLIRSGTIVFICALATFVIAGILAIRASKNNEPLLPCLWLTIMLCLVGETLILWRYNGIISFTLILLAFIANANLTGMVSNPKRMSTLQALG